MKLINKRKLAFSVAVSSLLDRTSQTIFLPTLPFLIYALHTTRALSQFVMVFYIAGIAVSQFAFGYLSDHFEKRFVIRLLFPIYILGGLTCYFSNNIEWFFLGIFFQGLGIGATYPISQAILTICYPPKLVGKMIALISFSITWLAALAPFISGHMAEAFGWRSVYLLIAGLGIVGLVATQLLPKSKLRFKKAIKIKRTFSDYLKIYSNITYFKYVFVIAMFYAGIFVFYTLSPFIFIHDLHISARHYGLYMFFVIIGLMIGRGITALIHGKIANHHLVYIAILIGLLASLSLLIFEQLHGDEPIVITIIFFIYATSIGIISPIAKATAMQTAITLVATAASLLSLTINSFSAIHSYLAAQYLRSELGWYYVVITGISLIVFFSLSLIKKNNI